MIFSKYARNKIVDALLRGQSITFPSTYYTALLVGAPDTGTDAYNEIGNVSPNGYARVAVTANTTNFAATNGAGTTTNPSTGTGAAQSSNNIDIVFADPTGDWKNGSGSISTITHVGFFDSATIGAGNLWFYVPITPKQVSASNTAPTIRTGALSIVLDR